MKQDGITRGPWTIEGPDQFGDFNIHHPADRLAIGAVVSNLRPSEEVAANAHFIVTACNAYEPMREALILAEKADRIHSKCQECEDGAQAPEACGDCFPSADDARVARRNVLKSLGVRMRDVDRARVAKAEPLTCKCSQEDVHDYGPCDEHCRSQPATAPHDEDLSRLKDALQLADGAFESIRNKLVNNLYEPERSAFWAAVNARDSIRAALSTLPVNDRRAQLDEARARVKTFEMAIAQLPEMPAIMDERAARRRAIEDAANVVARSVFPLPTDAEIARDGGGIAVMRAAAMARDAIEQQIRALLSESKT